MSTIISSATWLRRLHSESINWDEWVSAGRTRNYMLQDPLLDWLERYGGENGFVPDTEQAGYNPDTDFSVFLFDKGRKFEAAVLRYLESFAPISVIANEQGDSRRREKAAATFDAMVEGRPMISQGVFWDFDERAYGVPDLLVRSDVLHKLWPDAISVEQSKIPAPDLGGPWHYRVIDIKFTTLGLLADGRLGNGGSKPAYKAQLFVYNQALGRLQGYQPPVSYLLGRCWDQTIKGDTLRGQSCMDRLAPVFQAHVTKDGTSLASEVAAALRWVRTLRKNGSNWKVLPKPTVAELYPNMGNAEDGPWTAAKKQIAKEIEELTLLWNVGPDKRNAAHDVGVYKWRDPQCTAACVGVNGATTGRTLQTILDINQSDSGPLVQPKHITVAEPEWRPTPSLEFFVDFETVSDLDDSFDRIPQKGGQPLIFMIGCGHIEDGEWKFRCFAADALQSACEAKIIDAWLAHMKGVRERLAPDSEPPRVFHWSHAEVSTLESAYNSAVARHPERSDSWSEPRWFDFLKLVMKSQPVVVRGALKFGLKAVAFAMYKHGLIQTCWESGPTDGLGAMTGAWSCNRQAKEKNVRLIETPLMQEIEKYNEVDCKVMMEIISYLRRSN